MSDAVFSAAEAQAGASPSAGALLRLAREAQGLHIAALAVALKVPVKKLEALEADRFDLLPDVVFVRALAASVCRTLKVDPAPILDQLPVTSAPRLKTDAAGINAPFRTPGASSGMALSDQLSKPVVFAALVLLVGAMVLVFFPFDRVAELWRAARSDAAAPTAPATTSAPVLPDNPAAGPSTVMAAPAASLSLSMSEVPLPLNPAVASSAAAVPAQPANVPGALVPGSGTSTGMLVLTASGSSWVEVVDAAGVVQLRKTVARGETVGVSGVAPLAVVIGRADAVEVQALGKPFDLMRIAKDNVARFEVK